MQVGEVLTKFGTMMKVCDVERLNLNVTRELYLRVVVGMGMCEVETY